MSAVMFKWKVDYFLIIFILSIYQFSENFAMAVDNGIIKNWFGTFYTFLILLDFQDVLGFNVWKNI